MDYWNYLGWEDRFADPSFARRQRQFKSEGTARAVYTPGMMAGGLEWRDWRYRKSAPPVSTSVAGDLNLQVEGTRLQASFRPGAGSEPPDSMELHVAVLGFGLQTRVKRGENRGEILRHDFVVLGHQRYTGSGEWSGQLPELRYADEAERLALAAWVSSRDSQVPLQALGGWLDPAED